MTTVTCAGCGISFQKRSADVARVKTCYCSRECRGTKVLRVCEVCGVEFLRKRALVESHGGRFCSHACRGVARRQRVARTCVVCGKPFEVRPSEIGNHGKTAEHCSQACYGITVGNRLRGGQRSAEANAKQSAAMRGRPSPNKLPDINRDCSWCGEAFVVNRSRAVAAREQQRFCSAACWYEYLREHPEECALYRGGTERFYGPNWEEQAQRARERDNTTCQRCGVQQSAPALPVHHIRPRRAYDGDYLHANDLSNLVTLCVKCHSTVEWNEFNDWIKTAA